jgi:hypothetical protein
MQFQMNLPIHVGGKTTLQMQRYEHYLPLGQGAVVALFGTLGSHLPTWFQEYNWGMTLRYTMTRLFANAMDVGLSQKDMGIYAITISTPERAIMEVLYGIPRHVSFGEAALLMEGLTTLRPRVLQELLTQCRFVKVKRLFMVLAEECNQAWVKKLDVSQVKFGKGKRVIVKGGRFDAMYNIAIPINDSTRHASATSS